MELFNDVFDFISKLNGGRGWRGSSMSIFLEDDFSGKK